MWTRRDPVRPSLHVHWHLLNSSQPFGFLARVDNERLWADAETFPMDGRAVLGLAPHHLMLHLADHAVKHAFDRLILLADLRMILELHGADLDWALLLAEARAFGLLSSLALGLRLAARHTSAPLPAAVLSELAGVRLTFPERRLLDRFDRYRGRPAWPYLIYWSRCGGWGNRARFLMMSLYPDRSRLDLQLGGSSRWPGYLADTLGHLVASRRARRGKVRNREGAKMY